MIPYISFGPWHLGPFTIYPFGIMVGLAILVGAAVAQRRAEKLGIDPKLFSEAVIWLFVGGFVMAHWVSVLLYFPERVLRNPLELLKLWKGISSFGGFLGGVSALILYIKWKDLPFWTTLDAVAYGLVVGWVFGRGGCSLAHDHPGKCTNFPLAVKFPGWGLPCPDNYAARHDLGFYELLFTLVLAASVVVLNRKKRFTGFTLAFLCLAYAPVRFMLDFLRVGDRTYLGLTPGQYFSIALLGAGALVLVKRYNAPAEEFPPYDPETGEGGVMPTGDDDEVVEEAQEAQEAEEAGDSEKATEHEDEAEAKDRRQGKDTSEREKEDKVDVRGEEASDDGGEEDHPSQTTEEEGRDGDAPEEKEGASKGEETSRETPQD